MASSDIIKIGFDYRASLEQFEKETNGVFDGISDKAGKQKITIQLDAKDDKVIDKIKELQKLKLDKFTFEFGDSGLKEQLQTFDKLENKINEIINLSKGIDLSFNTKNKTEAYNQLKKYADAFKDYYGNEEAMATNAGAKAGYAYYKAYEEALRKGVAQSKLEKVTVDFDVNDSIFSKERIVENRIKEFESFQKYGNADESNLIAEITSLENRLLKFNSAYSQVKANLGDAPITSEITKNIEEYVRLLEVAESRAKDAEIFGYSYEDINSDKDLANMYLDFAKEAAIAENKKYIESLKQEETQATTTTEAEQKLAEAQKEAVSNTSNSNNSQIEELKSDIQDVKTELGDVKDRISSIESNGFENVREDVEKTKESVKELNSELTEMKSNLSSTPQGSNISSEKKDAFSDTSTDTKPETQGMEKVEKATEEAVQAKKEFATANEGVQSSIDGSENPLKLEAELMGQIAKYAREAAEAKKEFVEANKQVKESANESNSDLKAKPKKDRYAKRRKVSEEDFLNYSPNRVNEKLLNSGYTILGETVNTELVDGLVKVSAKIKDADGAWKSFSAKVDADGNIFEQRFKTVTNGVDKLETALQNFGRETAPALTYQETLDKAQKIKNSLNLGDEYSIKVDSNEFVTITKKLTDVENVGSSVTQTFKSAQDAIDNFGKATSNSAEKTSVALKSVKSNVKEVVDETEKLANSQKEQNANVNLNGYDKRLDSYQGKINKYDTTIKRFEDGGWSSDTYLKNVQAVRDAVKQYATLLDHIKINQNGIASDEDIQNLDKYEKKIKDIIATVTNMSASEKGYNFVSGQKELDKIHKLLNENSKMSSEAKAKIKAYYKEIESGNPSMSLDKIHGEIMKIYNAEVEAGRAGKSFFDTLKNSGFHQIAAQMAGMFGFYDVINLGKEGFNVVRELNTALTEMRKVSNETVQSLKNYQATTFDTADAVGTTAKQIQNSTADWMRLGESMNQAAESAKDANVLLNVSEFEGIDEATESLVSMSQAYKDLDKMDIIDVLNNIGNNYSISTDGLATALKDSASALVTANNDLNEAVSLTTAGNAITQDPSKVGAGLRTISLRLVGTEEAKEELSDLGEETDGMITTVSKLRDTIMDATKAASSDGKGFDILDSNGNYKSTYEIMQGLADLYDDIVKKDKELGTNNLNLLLETIAGKNRSNIAASILQNGDMLRSVYEDAQNSEGSAEKELNSYLDSIDGKMAQLENRAQEFWFKVIDSETIKNGIDLLSTLLKGATDFVDTVGLLPTIFTGIGAALSFKNVGIDTLVAY